MENSVISSPVFVSNAKISVKEFISKWKDKLSDELSWIKIDNDSSNNDRYESMANQIDKPINFVKQLDKNLNMDKFIDQLISDGNYNVEINEKDPKLNPNHHTKLKYQHKWLNRPIETIKDKHSDDCNHDQLLAILTVQIFRPSFKFSTSKIKLKLDREFEVLSCQKLSTLRDSYFCLSDLLNQSDYSENPDKCVPKKMKNHEKIGIFIIENTFYYDDRFKSESFDSLIDWSKKSMNVNQSDSIKKSINDTKFEDLSITLGYPYCYMHRNNCEHLLVFTDIRLFIPNDQNSVNNYPRFTVMEKIETIKCQMCRLYTSKWLTLGNRRLPFSPYYFCHNCFVTFNYDQDLKKIGTFRAFPLVWDVN